MNTIGYPGITYGADTSRGSQPLAWSTQINASKGSGQVPAGQNFAVAFPAGSNASYDSCKLQGGNSQGFLYRNWTAQDGQQIFVFRAPGQEADMQLKFSTSEGGKRTPSQVDIEVG
ncbi:MAG TPA: hypothetical protein VGO93_21740 [Candidatus Xenobia bacterium]